MSSPNAPWFSGLYNVTAILLFKYIVLMQDINVFTSTRFTDFTTDRSNLPSHLHTWCRHLTEKLEWLLSCLGRIWTRLHILVRLNLRRLFCFFACNSTLIVLVSLGTIHGKSAGELFYVCPSHSVSRRRQRLHLLLCGQRRWRYI